MKKGWNIILVIVLVAILLGAVCVGVGLMTGGDMPRVLGVMEERYHPDVYYAYAGQVYDAVVEAIQTPAA